MRNEACRQQNVARCRNVVACFIPEVRKSKQGHVQQKNKYEDDRKYQSWVTARPLHSIAMARLVILQSALLSRSGNLSRKRHESAIKSDRASPPRVRRGIAGASSTQIRNALVHLPAGAHPRVEFDFAERSFIAVDVLLQQSEQSFGLLRT